MTTHSENARQWVHVGSGSFALLLRVLTWRQAAAMAGVALVFNLLVLPRIGGRRLYRPVDDARGFPLGILIYPLAVLLLILIFPSRLDIAAAAWGILAFGDGAATLVGRRVGGQRLPWNAEKTIAGTIGFVACATAGGIALAWWTRPDASRWFTILAPLAAAIAGGLVESIPVRLDDNISVPVAAGGVLWIASLMTADAFRASRPAIAAAVPWAIGLNVAAAWAGHRARTVSRSGAIGGAVVGALIYLGGGPGAWALLLVTFIFASVASRAGLRRKMRLGIAEEHGGRRGAGNAFANCGVAAMAAVAAVTTPYPAAAVLALVVALKGTVAGLIAALAMATIAASLGLISGGVIPVVVMAATIGALVESALGATLEGPGILNNDMLNFINTAVAAAVALVVA